MLIRLLVVNRFFKAKCLFARIINSWCEFNLIVSKKLTK
ncbi:hypothetical protein GMES_0031 [Paraglaciecola mesophila KMM 241]|uniref:Uncharacterized protein n=1 Tax=Paraglaciecola mesophila KMM 241 TaxID=1128912 RepID=K6YW09_9ALTE|nr:hypothetical protein GMES_0031 [Paraglaciecola mesophila KMM 241]